MIFRLEINMNNDAFDGCNGNEVCNILHELAFESLTQDYKLDDYGLLRDHNGNTVGKWKVLDD